ncbi:MAG TPA: Rrf2 family transcriptional regulator [Candidatus Cloacimonadota bacterium]|nr:Rrf2 family transcriptional regulator [Candidatus Cloacimonadota bacterium]HPT72809.1 Rrf2 family transcriptional regulator [Candidatus Cloacimonadota bacterium]
MQITTKTEYSVRALIEVGIHEGNPVSLREICAAQQLPEKYMEQLFSKLKKKNIIISIPGAHGGYRLARDAKDINMQNIMDAAEDNSYQPYCSGKPENEFCIGNPCVLQQLWQDLHLHMKGYLETLTLQQIMDRIKEASHG